MKRELLGVYCLWIAVILASIGARGRWFLMLPAGLLATSFGISLWVDVRGVSKQVSVVIAKISVGVRSPSESLRIARVMGAIVALFGTLEVIAAVQNAIG
jgi:hypothetical protein